MPVRALLLAGAAAAIVLLAVSLHAYNRCEGARAVVFRATFGRASPGAERAAIDQIRSSCTGSLGLLAAAGSLHASGRDRGALALALAAARAEPRDARAWHTVLTVAEDHVPAEARAAERRLARLDPLGTSFRRSSGRSSSR